ncbi:MAG: tetratricopeptide repeat protein [Thermoanaerobaculia bacterium]
MVSSRPSRALTAALATTVFLLSIVPSLAVEPIGDPLAAVQAAVDGGDTERALHLLGPILKREPKNARALLLRSTARCIGGEIDDCRKDLDQALALDPALRQGWLNRAGLAISEKRYDDALVALAQAEKLDPAASDNAINLGAVYLLQGKLEQASHEFERHLVANSRSAAAYYLVATNFALAGYSALAAQHLGRAIELDERSRVRARGDSNFTDLASSRAFQVLLTSDTFVAPAGSTTASRIYRSPYKGANSPLLVAVMNQLQISGTQMDPTVEVTDDWALLWSDARIKIVRRSEQETAIELSAPPGIFSAAAWDQRTHELYDGIDKELLKLERSGLSRP